MKKKKMYWNRIILVISIVLISCQPQKEQHVFLIGDSTMANKPVINNPERGWGQMFNEFFTMLVHIHNHAKNGRSTKSFIDEGRWQTVVDSLQPGNYVFIQFGHNDQKAHDSTRYTAPYGAYKNNLMRFVNDTRAKEAYPLLLTPVMRRRFNERGEFYDTHGDYPSVVREVAREMQIPLIDLHESSKDLIETVGVEESKKIFLWIKPGKYKKFPEGKEDNTHFSEHGARLIACLVSHGLQQLDIELKKYLFKDYNNCY